MSNNSLLLASRKKFKVNPIAFICLGVLFCVFAALCVALSLLVPFLGAVAVVLILFPLLCGITMQASSIEYFDKVSFKNIFFFSLRYYSPQFSGSFRLLCSLLKALIVSFGSTIVVTIIVCLVAKGMYPTAFDECFPEVMKLLYLESTIEDLNTVFAMDNHFVENCFYFIQTISLSIASLVFITSVAFNTLGVYFRMLLKPTGIMFGKYSINTAINNNRRALFKNFMYLNWPLILLATLGMITGYLLSIFKFESIYLSFDIGLITAFIFMMFYAPKYFANMNALFDKYKILIVYGINDSIKKTLDKIQRSMDLSSEDKQKIAEALQECDEDLKQMEEEDNKKDSTE